MKKIVLISMLMAFGLMANAMNPQEGRDEGTHWIPNWNLYANNLTIVGAVQLDGITLSSDIYEIGAFSGDELRGSYILEEQEPDYYLIYLTVMGDNGDPITFKIYNHDTSEELDVTCNNSLVFEANAEYGAYDDPYIIDFRSNLTITASANPTAGGTVDGAGTYAHGTSCTLTATPNTGYHFVNWTLNGTAVSTNANYTFTVSEAANYVANFQLNTYSVTATANPTAGGTITGAGTYTHGNSCTLTATANTGYTFINWTLNGVQVSTNAAYTFTVTEAAQYVANFQLNSYAITVSANPTVGGTVTGAGTYNYGTACTLTATANTGYTFINWTLNGTAVSTNPNYTFTVSGAANYVANFQINSYAITVLARPDSYGTVTGAGTYNHGTNCSLTATPSTTYYTFINWTKGEEIVSEEANYSFTVTETAQYVANFGIDYYWDPVCESYTSSMTAIGIIQIEGEEQFSPTLELGAFCGTECRGRELVVFDAIHNRYFVYLTICGNGGDVLTFRLYDHATETESDKACEATLLFEAGTEVGSTTTPFVFNFTDIHVQTNNLLVGWSWYSTYIEQNSIDGMTMLKNELGTNGLTIKSQSKFVNYNPNTNRWTGSLNSIDNVSTYMIRVANPCTVNMTGLLADPSAHPITLKPGWTWIGYPVATVISIADAFAGYTPAVGDQVKSQNSFATYNGTKWNGSLKNIEPGKGYMYKSNKTTNATLVFPNGAKGETLNNLTPENNHWVPNLTAYPNNMTMIAVVEFDNAELRAEHYELAAFADGECRGSFALVYEEDYDRYMAYLTIAGEEVADLSFSLYNAKTDETFEADNYITFSTNAIVGSLSEPYVVSFRSTTGLAESSRRIQVYPNPVAAGEHFSLGLPDGASARVEVLNALGIVMSTETMSQQRSMMTAPKVAGVYTLRIVIDENTYSRRLVVK